MHRKRSLLKCCLAVRGEIGGSYGMQLQSLQCLLCKMPTLLASELTIQLACYQISQRGLAVGFQSKPLCKITFLKIKMCPILSRGEEPNKTPIVQVLFQLCTCLCRTKNKYWVLLMQVFLQRWVTALHFLYSNQVFTFVALVFNFFFFFLL